MALVLIAVWCQQLAMSYDNNSYPVPYLGIISDLVNSLLLTDLPVEKEKTFKEHIAWMFI